MGGRSRAFGGERLSHKVGFDVRNERVKNKTNNLRNNNRNSKRRNTSESKTTDHSEDRVRNPEGIEKTPSGLRQSVEISLVGRNLRFSNTVSRNVDIKVTDSKNAEKFSLLLRVESGKPLLSLSKSGRFRSRNSTPNVTKASDERSRDG